MKKESHIERVLIVLNPDGSLKAAQGERLERVLDDDGSVVAERYLPAEPLTEETLAKVLPDKARLIADLSLALADIDRLRFSA